MSRKITADTYVDNFGWLVRSFRIEGAEGDFSGVTPGDFDIRNDYVDITNHTRSKGVQQVIVEKDAVTLKVDPFKFGGKVGFVVIGKGAAAPLSFTKDEVDERTIETVDDFEAKEENGVLYRLWTPKAQGKRPLFLFLHGGGESGFDNFAQMVGTIGAGALAERYPDMYIMAPQAPGGGIPVGVPLIEGRPGGAQPVAQQNGVFAPGAQPSNTGWCDSYLLKIAAIIEKMIADGKVDEKRIYVTGMSMGGGGTLRMVGLRQDLFTAAAPMCPTMTDETLAYLKGYGDFKIWISMAYIDHTPIRHCRIIDGIRTLQRGGNQNAKYTMFSPDELAAYGIAVYPDLTEAQILSENHHCWVLTLRNEYGILDWVTSQVKE